MADPFGILISALGDLFFSEMFGTNFLMIVSCLLLTGCLLSMLRSTSKFHVTLDQKLDKEDKKKVDELRKEVVSGEQAITDVLKRMEEYEEAIEASKKTFDQLLLEKSSNTTLSASDRTSIQSTALMIESRINDHKKSYDDERKKKEEKEKLVREKQRSIEEIEMKRVDHVVHVDDQMKTLGRIRKVTKVAGFFAIVSLIVAFLLHGAVSIVYSRVSGVTFMLSFTMTKNLEELLHELRDVLVTGDPDRQISKDMEVISKRTYLEIVKYKNKLFYNPRRNAATFMVTGILYIVPFMLVRFAEFSRIADVFLLFLVSQFASISLFKYYVNTDTFKEHMKFSFYRFLKRRLMVDYDSNDPVLQDEYVKLIMHYVSFHFKNSLNKDFARKEHVYGNIVKRYLEIEDKNRAEFSSFLEQLLYYNPNEITKLIGATPDLGRFDPAKAIKVLATIITIAWTIMQISKFLSNPE